MMNEQHDTSAIATIHSIPTPAAQAAPGSLQPFVLRSMFWRPAWLAESSCVEHVPFALWLIEAARPRLVAEVGIANAVSYFAFCQAVDRLRLDTRCYGLHTGGDAKAAGAEYEAARSYNEAQHAAFSRLSSCHVSRAPEGFSAGSIDLLHLNGTLESMEDFDAWLPKLSDRALVLIHGIENRGSASETADLYAVLKCRYPHFDFAQGQGLGMLGVGTQRAPLVSSLFAAHDSEHLRQGLQEMFARLGRACLDHQAATKQHARAIDLSEQVALQQKQLEEVKQSLDKTKGDLNNRSKELNEARARLQTQLEQHAVERGQLAERVNLLQEVRAELKDEVTRLHGALDSAQAELHRRQEEMRTLVAEAAESKTRAAVIERVLQSREADSAEGPSALEREQEMRKLVAEAAESKARAVVIENLLQRREAELAESQSAVERLRHELAAAVEGCQRSAEQVLLHKTAEARAVEQAAVLARQLDEQSIAAKRAVDIAREDAERQILEATRRTSEAERALQGLRDELFANEGALRKVRDDAARQMDTYAEKEATYRARELRYSDETARLTKLLGDAEQALKDAIRQREAKTTEVAQARQAAAAAEKRAQELTAATDKQVAELRAAVKTLTDDKERQSQLLKAAVDEGNRAKKDANQLEGRLTQCEGERARLAADAANKTKDAESLRAAKAKAEAALQTRFAEISKLTSMLGDVEKQLDAERVTNKALRGELEAAKRASKAAQEQVSAAQREASAAQREAENLRKNLSGLKQSASWKITAPVRMVARRLRGQGSKKGIEHQAKVLLGGGIFDASWYLTRYPDVKQAGIDPALHYLQFGAAEKRDPGPQFSTEAYMNAYPDVANSGLNPLLHYMNHGRAEGRVVTCTVK
jgi:chromosome segregation ATPase